MRITYNGMDIQDAVSVNYCVHEMHAEQHSDTLTVRFNDPDGLWSRWNPVSGDTVQVEEGHAKTGRMYICSTRAENGLFTVRAMSMQMRGWKRSRSWENIRFLRVAEEAAASSGLSVAGYGCTDHLYPYLAQENETDLGFFSRLCTLEGCQMLIYNGRLVVYNEAYMEAQEPSGTIEVKEDGDYIYNDTGGQLYDIAEVDCGKCHGYFRAPGADGSRIYRHAGKISASDTIEATRFARSLLRQINKDCISGRLRRDLLTSYAPASVLEIKTHKASKWDGKAFIKKIRNDYAKKESIIYFRKPLEGY